MMRNLLATTALATLLATSAFAQQDPAQPAPAPEATQPMAPAATDATQPATTDAAAIQPEMKAEGYLATNIIGESVYNGTGDNAENIGDVNDIVLDKEGKTQAVIVGVGGFLGMGEHNVAVEFTKLSWADKDGDRWLVFPSTKEELQALPAFDRTPYDPAATPVASAEPSTAPATDTTAQAPADTTTAPATDQTAQAPAPAEPATTDTTNRTAEAPAATDQPATTDQTAQAPATTDQPAATDSTTTAAIDKSTLTEIPAGELKAEELVGTTVYGANDENVGEINDLVLTQDGKVEAVIIDVGGFLGIGEKQVAVGFDKLAFMTDKDGNKYLYTNFTKEQLEAQVAYDKGTYADQRDKMLMTVQ